MLERSISRSLVPNLIIEATAFKADPCNERSFSPLFSYCLNRMPNCKVP